MVSTPKASSTSKTKTLASKNTTKASSLAITNSKVPIYIKRDCWKKDTLICESQDLEVSFVGDSGAVGRMTVEDNQMILDLKGQQFAGEIVAGPSIMILNLAAPVGGGGGGGKKKSDEGDNKDGDDTTTIKDSSNKEDKEENNNSNKDSKQQVAKCELYTNEFCRLEFKQDMLQSLRGEITGSGLLLENDDIDESGKKRNPKISTVTTKAPKKAHKAKKKSIKPKK